MSADKILIVMIRSMPIADETLFGGDLFDAERYEKEGLITSTTVRQLQACGNIGPLTKENYERCMVHRPAGTVGKPFTKAELIEWGILSDAPPPVGERKAGDKIEVTTDSTYYNKWFITPQKKSNFTFYDVTCGAGRLVRPNSFKTLDAAKEYIDTVLEPKPAPEGAEEAPADDSNLQPEPVG